MRDVSPDNVVTVSYIHRFTVTIALANAHAVNYVHANSGEIEVHVQCIMRLTMSTFKVENRAKKNKRRKSLQIQTLI